MAIGGDGCISNCIVELLKNLNPYPWWSGLVLLVLSGVGARSYTGNWELSSAGVMCFQINPQTYEMLQLF